MKKILAIFFFLLFFLVSCDTNMNGNEEVTIKVNYPDTTLNVKVVEGQKLDLEERIIPGYNFVGFYFKDGTDVSSVYYYSSFGKEVDAKYELATYTLTYSYNNEKKEYQLHYLDDIPSFSPTLEGYNFLGWKDYNALFKDDKYTQTKDITLVAVFEGIKYNLTYNILGEEYTTQKVAYQSPYELISAPSMTGYKFIRWECTNPNYVKEDTFNYQEDFTFNGIYEKEIYHINYYVDDKLVKTEDVNYSDDLTLYQPTKVGHMFKHWLLNDEIYNKRVFEFEHDIDLVAVFEYNLVIDYNYFDGTLIGEESVEDGFVNLKQATLDGYIFNGWYSDKYYLNKIDKLDLASGITTLYAKFILDDDNYKDSYVYTLYNSMTSKYDEVSLYSGDQTSITSLYWKKYTIVKNNDKYYVSAIADSGTSLPSMGSFDYLLEAFTNFSDYKNFCKLNVSVGDEVRFLIDPTLHQEKNVHNIVSFLKVDLGPTKDEILAYLKNLYDSYNEIDNDLNLVDSYNDFNITWSSSNSGVISNTGKYMKPKNDETVTLTAYVNSEEVYSFTVIVKGTGANRYLSTGYVYTNYSNLTQFALNNLDIIYPSFLNIDAEANWVNLNSAMNKINTYIRPKSDLSGTKIVVSINQENHSGAFSAVAASEELRKKFAQNICDVVVNNNLDGIDIDWETPATAEKENFTLMMKEIYTSLKKINPNYLVTAAIGGGKWAPPKYDLPNSINYLDYINMMTYSMASSYSYYQNSLYKSTHKATLVSCSIDESITIYNQNQIPNNKILVGIPFYVVLHTDSEGYGSQTGTGKSISYSSFLNNYRSLETMVDYFDEECGVPYSYDATNKYFASYESPRSIQLKSQYIHEKGLAGLMFWQYGQDVNDFFMTAISQYLNA